MGDFFFISSFIVAATVTSCSDIISIKIKPETKRKVQGQITGILSVISAVIQTWACRCTLPVPASLTSHYTNCSALNESVSWESAVRFLSPGFRAGDRNVGTRGFKALLAADQKVPVLEIGFCLSHFTDAAEMKASTWGSLWGLELQGLKGPGYLPGAKAKRVLIT